MIIIDAALIVIILLSGVLGYITGLISELMRIFVWIGSIVGAYYIYFFHHDLLPQINPLLLIIILFISLFIILKLLQKTLDKSIEKSFLAFINKPMGFIYGLIRGLVIVLSIGHLLTHFGMESKLIHWLYTESQPYVDIKQKEETLIYYGQKIIEKFEKEFMKK